METVSNWRGTSMKSRCIVVCEQGSLPLCYLPFPYFLRSFVWFSAWSPLCLAKGRIVNIVAPRWGNYLGPRSLPLLYHTPSIVLSVFVIWCHWKLVSSIHNTFSFPMTSYRVSIRVFTIYLPAILFAPPPATEGIQQLVCRTKGTREALEIFSLPGESLLSFSWHAQSWARAGPRMPATHA